VDNALAADLAPPVMGQDLAVAVEVGRDLIEQAEGASGFLGEVRGFIAPSLYGTP
jgi:hypothetical protein